MTVDDIGNEIRTAVGVALEEFNGLNPRDLDLKRVAMVANDANDRAFESIPQFEKDNNGVHMSRVRFVADQNLITYEIVLCRRTN